MDSIFYLEDGDRAAFLDQMMQAFGCAYVCLKYYVPPPYNCLRGLDGIYQERGSSHGSLARRLFDVYRESSNYHDNGLIPGLAFSSNSPYIKLELHDFQRLASSDFQLQFYQEAGIKTVVLMGCAAGEIELGMSHENPQVDLEMEMKNLIRINFPHQTDPNNPHSSSSSSLRSLSVDSSEYPPLLFNIPTASRTFLQQPPNETLIGETPLEEALRSAAPPIQSLNPFPPLESEEAVMTKAILAVLSSPSPSSSTPSSSQNLRPTQTVSTAFRRYRQPPAAAPPRIPALNPKHSKFKRAVFFFRNLSLRSRQELQIQGGSRPTPNQLHHMISERRRREKQNESYHRLRSLLPQGTKKDKASVLSNTTEYLTMLISQVAELVKRNRVLESQLEAMKKSATSSEFSKDRAGSSISPNLSGGRVSVELVPVSSSSSEERFLDLRVTVRGGISMTDLIIRMMEFLKGRKNVDLSSIESNTTISGSVAVHATIMRLRIEGDEFDESGFQEAVKRVVGDEAN